MRSKRIVALVTALALALPGTAAAAQPAKHHHHRHARPTVVVVVKITINPWATPQARSGDVVVIPPDDGQGSATPVVVAQAGPAQG